MSRTRDGRCVTRRRFLRSAAVAAAGAALTPAAIARAHRTDPPLRPICVFSKHLQFLDYAGMAEAAAAAGFEGVDLTVRPGGHVLPERVRDDLPRAVEAVRAAGLSVPMMTTRVSDPDDPTTRAVLETASELDIGYYRMGYLSYDLDKGIAASLDDLQPVVAELADMNRQYGIHGAYQNHAGTRVGGPVWDLWILFRDLDPRWIGVQYDVRHATVEGARAWPLGMRLLSPFIRITALKDFVWEDGDVRNVPLGEGLVDFDQYFEIVREEDVSGPVSLHFEYPLPGEEDGMTAARRRDETVEVMQRDVKRLRSMMSAAGL